MDIYRCEWNGKTRHVEAYNRLDAENRFEEKYGFFPSEDLVTISKTQLRALPNLQE